jgi:hypothetical protein
MHLIDHVLFILVAAYFLLAERGIIKLPNQKRQQEFDERIKNKRWRYCTYLLGLSSCKRFI